jgi:hypothetical protein
MTGRRVQLGEGSELCGNNHGPITARFIVVRLGLRIVRNVGIGRQRPSANRPGLTP